MREFLYAIMDLVARFHGKILSLNDTYEAHFSDKQLHFLIVGLAGMALLLVVHPLFARLAKKGHVLVISWLYVFTLIVGLSFAIEIGQHISHSGNMEFADIMFGLVGFLAMFAAFALLRGLWRLFRRAREKAKAPEREAQSR